MKSSDALASSGVFHRSATGFTPRTAQQEMASAVEDALAHGGALVVESGTGTGKTYAYLVPIILSGRRTIISTATKHLQEQIFNRDLPQVAKALGKPVDVALLKGRSNYLCRYRLNLQMQQSDLIGKAEIKSYQAIAQWAAKSKHGDISEVVEISEESLLWKQVTTTADNCLGGQCPDFKQCFVVKARQRAMQADIVVVNHHLFFSDYALRSDGFGELLPDHEAVVFDEAHSVAEVASVSFGFAISGAQIADLIRDVQSAERDERSTVKLTGSIASLEKALQRVHKASKSHAGKSVDWDTLQNAPFDKACDDLTDALAQFEQALVIAARAGEGLRRCHQRCLLMQEHLDTWRNGGDNLIRWAEVGARWFRFHGTPLQIDQDFVEMMKCDSPKRPATWIFTSATLAVGDDFSAFCEQLGLQDAQTRRWNSPYNFRENALLYLPTAMPEPRAGDYDRALVAVIFDVISASRGRAFCLFTSHAMMNRVHKILYDDDDATSAWTILLQGEAPKSELLKRFRHADHAVLFGTASFWQGVDVVGEDLSCVIIDKLPFASPSDPVLKSKLQNSEAQGGNPFMDWQVPGAVIALKQGAGRLIRSETDRGVLVLCDPRVVSKPYGKLFLNSLPDMTVTREMNVVRKFFADVC